MGLPASRLSLQAQDCTLLEEADKIRASLDYDRLQAQQKALVQVFVGAALWQQQVLASLGPARLPLRS